MTDNPDDLCIRILNEADDPDRFDNYADDDMALSYVRELKDERDRLREALARYGCHDDNCFSLRALGLASTGPCDCGLDAARHERIPVPTEDER